MTPVIEIDGLRKEYRRLRRPPTVALDGLDLEVSEGGVFGLLGPNGPARRRRSGVSSGSSPHPQGERASSATTFLEGSRV